MTESVFTDAYALFLAALIAARKGRRLRQKDLGQLLGKSQPWVSNYERGVRRIDVVEFYAIAKALKRSPVDLFAKIVEQFPPKVTI